MGVKVRTIIDWVIAGIVVAFFGMLVVMLFRFLKLIEATLQVLAQ
jgi:hypothetical protein